ncbi:MAG: hypothetical protein KME45_32255 [Stenomitos rutilans HA7619-LM2]|jgi:uncharacterized protein (TIGR02646 family)|nr:hypothetical protein [Stenomitos rutilans HA7619-LM2]
MIQLPDLTLPETTQNRLNRWQMIVDGVSTYKGKVSTGKSLFSSYNTTRNTTFKQVRQVLTEMCSGARRCAYCEDSVADEVEHIKPKDLYPESVFVWENYLYACGPCNGPKNSQFAVFSSMTARFTNVTRGRNAPVVPPESGDPVLINPRIENPLDFFHLDLAGTFYFLPRFQLNAKNKERAEYTIKILRLNERDYLARAREEAFNSYRARLSEYISHKVSGVEETQLDNRVKALQRMQHPTVWREMQRQQALIPELSDLFDQAPEAILW